MWKFIKLSLVFWLMLFGLGCIAQVDTVADEVEFQRDDFTIKVPDLFVSGIETTGEINCLDQEKLAASNHIVSVVVNGKRQELYFENGKANFPLAFDRNEPLSIKAGEFTYVRDVKPMPLWLSIIPPLIVILLALVFKEVVSSLIIGIVSGACITGFYAYDGSIWYGLFRFIDTYVVQAMSDSGHISVMVFSTLIGGIVAVISKNGGMQAVVDSLSRKAINPKSGQMATYFLGIAIFFDDYANTLVVGNTMRPLTDRLRISREKLSYIVDSTAAPVAAIALITTWIGAELGYIQGALDTINAKAGISYPHGIEESAYAVFLGSLEYAYYPIFTLAFMLMLILMNRDFGPMHKAESRARLEGNVGKGMLHSNIDVSEFEPEKDIKYRMINAILPISVVVLGTVIGLLVTGYDATIWSDPANSFGKSLSLTIGKSDSYKALLWSSMSGLIVAIAMTAFQKIQTFPETIETSISGFKTMVSALVILILAWSLASITGDMHTADYLAGLASGTVVEWAVPAITFLIAAVVAFSTGSSWGTMAIVYPLMLPLSWELSMQGGVDASVALGHFFNVSACVLAGSVLGDHCSPISDTTILSSLATHCNHIEHVRTQMPYALTVGGVSILFTLIGAYMELPWILDFPLGIFMLFLIVRFLGKVVPDPGGVS